jgi:hypothetical protein
MIQAAKIVRPRLVITGLFALMMAFLLLYVAETIGLFALLAKPIPYQIKDIKTAAHIVERARVNEINSKRGGGADDKAEVDSA